MSALEVICDRPSPYRRDKFANRLIDYSKEDLFKDWSEEELISSLNACLNTQPINLELSTLILDNFTK